MDIGLALAAPYIALWLVLLTISQRWISIRIARRIVARRLAE